MAATKDPEQDDTQNRTGADMTILAQGVVEPLRVSSMRASLVVLAGWEIGKELEVHGRAQVVGRSNVLDTFINAPSVSRHHAQIDLVDDPDDPHFTITDLGSSNGTHVNNEQTRSVRLENGDRIRMGDVLFKFALQDDIESEFHREIHRRIHYDQLTGLLTMEAFRMRLDSLLRDSRKPFTLAMTDLDGLKRVNDSYGHLAGRMIVREMGAMMRASLRPTDIAGLYGGDEGIIIYPKTSMADAVAVAEKLRGTIEARVFEHRGHSFSVTISQGLAEYPVFGHTAEELISAADKALYAAKASGRNRVCCAERPTS